MVTQSRAATGTAPVEWGRPNAFDRKCIERALDKRKRYRYVSPALRAVDGGFVVESPCCSRRIDAAGGVIEVALIRLSSTGFWQLHFRNHAAGEWKLYDVYQKLNDLLDPLIEDSTRLFWQ